MPDWGIISAKLERLWEDRERLEAHRQLSGEEFLADHTVQGDACYLFLTAIQGGIDTAAKTT